MNFTARAIFLNAFTPPTFGNGWLGSSESPPRLNRLLDLLLVIVLSTWCSSLAQTSAADPTIEGIRVGFNGKFKVGHWTPIWVTIRGGDESEQGQLQITLPDGDGVQTQYIDEAETINVPGESSESFLRYVKFGRTRGRVKIQLRNDEQFLCERSFSAAEVPAAAASTRDMYITIGNDAGVNNAFRIQRRLDNNGHGPVAATIKEPRYLPEHWIGYEGVAALVLTTSNYNLIEQISDAQLQAIEQWVKLGGRLILSIGSNGEKAFSDGGRLARFAPGKLDRIQILDNTANLETYAKATKPLNALPGADEIQFTSLRDVTGVVESIESGTGHGPTIVRSGLGFGQVVFVAVDLDQPPFTRWQARPRLIGRLIQSESDPAKGSDSGETVGKVAREGFDDLAGQLRMAMDQFQGVTLVSFTVVATLIVVYILLIGPADYFLLQNVLRRMELTWVTFPTTVVVFCALAFYLARSWKIDELRVNQVELVDIDARSGLVRGTMWAHVYSPKTEQFNLSFQPQSTMECDLVDVAMSWQGLPGDGLGGMNTQSTVELFSEPYSIVRTPLNGSGTTRRLSKVPIQVASSKTLCGRWWGTTEVPVRSRLRVDAFDSLHGDLDNPFDVELQDCIVSHGGWTYRLNRKLGPRENITIEEMSDRSIKMYLSRSNSGRSGTGWDQSSDDVPRIVEMMMYHRVAGGSSLTALTHGYQRFTDLSGHLDLGLAILTGWTHGRAGGIQRDDKSLVGDYDRQWTFYRIVLPVEKE